MTIHNLKVMSAMAKHIAGKETSRYYLNGVVVEEHGDHALYVATDGHIMTVYRHAGEYENKSYIVPKDLLVNSQKASPKEGLCEMTVAGRKISLKVGYFTFEGPTIDDSYPDWRRVLPEPGYEQEIAYYNPEVLMRVKKFMKDAGYAHNVYPAGNGGNYAALLCVEDGACVAAVMPMRIINGARADSITEKFW